MSTDLSWLQFLCAGPAAAAAMGIAAGIVVAFIVFVVRLGLELRALGRRDSVERYESAQLSLHNAIDLGARS